MNIAVAANRSFLKYLYVMLVSLLESHAKENLQCTIYLLSADLKEEDTEQIKELTESFGGRFCLIRVEIARFPKELPSNEMITVETYFRLALPDLLPPEAERVLYLDADLIVNGSLRELYETDFAGKSFAACKDVTTTSAEHVQSSPLFAELREKEGFMYFNAGVLLFNLKKIRRIYDFEFFMGQAVKLKDELVFHDQDLLNYLFWNDVAYADAERFNLAARTAFNAGYGYSWVKDHTAIVHYAGPKPWRHKEVRYDLERFWWECAKKTPFYTELLEEMVWPEMETGYMDQLFRQLKQENDELRKIVDQCMHLLKANIHLT